MTPAGTGVFCDPSLPIECQLVKVRSASVKYACITGRQRIAARKGKIGNEITRIGADSFILGKPRYPVLAVIAERIDHRSARRDRTGRSEIGIIHRAAAIRGAAVVTGGQHKDNKAKSDSTQECWFLGHDRGFDPNIQKTRAFARVFVLVLSCLK